MKLAAGEGKAQPITMEKTAKQKEYQNKLVPKHYLEHLK